MMETPTITASSYASSNLSIDELQRRLAKEAIAKQFNHLEAGRKDAGISGAIAAGYAGHANEVKGTPVSTTRIVKVIIADTNDNLPLNKRVLYTGDEQLTDLTDQELFFEVPIAELLAKHNDTRKATVDKKASEKFGRDIFLEPVRIRDLKMVVVTVAQF